MRESTAWVVAILGSLLIIAVVAISVSVTAIVADSVTRDELPRCRENQVLVGHGNFAHGQWDQYTCGPALD